METLRELLHAVCAAKENAVLVRYLDGAAPVDVTGGRYFGDIAAMAASPEARCLTGRRAAIFAENGYPWLVCFGAVAEGGGVAVCLSAELGAPEVVEAGTQTGFEAIVCDADHASDAAQAAAALDIPCLLTETGPDGSPSLRLVREGGGRAARTVPLPPDAAAVLFTSGTTGRKKAVVHTHAAFCASTEKPFAEGPGSALVILPFHHVGGIVLALNVMRSERTLCIGQARRLLRCLEKLRPNAVFLVPAMADMLMKRLERHGWDQERLGWALREIFPGAAAFSPAMAETFERAGVAVIQVYGATETCAMGACGRMTPERPGSIGRPVPCVEIRIEDGELLIRGTPVMAGYCGDDALTAETLRDGWYHTGDLARADADGYLYLTGRKKNLIILSNGENISPEEVEAKIAALGGVAESELFAEDDRLVLEIVPEPGADPDAAAEAVRRDYNPAVPTYMQIRDIRLRAEPLPRTATGKLLRRGRTESV